MVRKDKKIDMAMYTLHLFAGAGGGILADSLLGHAPIGACEIEEYPRRVLLQRQLDGILPVFPIWDDIKTLRSDNPECAEAFRTWRELSQQLIVCGGFPCQDISAAGRGEGITGERSGLWGEMARVIGEIRPRFAFVENSPLLVSRGLEVVLGDLAEMGYDARWGIVGAGHLLYPIKRNRIWILGRNNKINEHGAREIHKRANIKEYVWGAKQPGDLQNVETSWLISNNFGSSMAYGDASELDEIEAIGNAQVPAVAAFAFRKLMEDI